MHDEAITLQRLRALRPGASRIATTVMSNLLGLGLNLPGRRVHFVVEGWERVPREPAVFVTNHTHWLDWIGMRWVSYRRGRSLCNWVKPRTYEEGWTRFLDLTGNVPVVSRGYLIAADVRAVTGRQPTEDEYRAIRDLLDTGAELPDEPLYDLLQTRSRTILGLPFDPSEISYRGHLETLFHQMMSATVDKTRPLLDAGMALSIYPQGVTSMRLTRGHPGAVQAALALDLPLVPFGVSGFPQCWNGKQMLPARGGTVTVRVGEPWSIQIPGLTPFLPRSEREQAAALEAETRGMMARIDALLDPEHQRASGQDETDVTGVARFI